MFQQNDNARTRVKICGLTTLEDARYASGAMADYLGFIFVPGSKRYVNPDLAAAIIAWTEGPEPVGVFMNQPLDDVIDIINKSGVKLAQLHGTESVEYCSLMPVPVIKSIAVEAGDTKETILEKTRPYLGLASYILFDTKVDGQSGGTGTAFDWAVLEISLLKDIIMPAVGDAWHDAYEALDAIAALSAGEEYPPQFAPLAVTRSIIAQLLTTPDRWAEYQIALLFCILRALTWDNDSLGSRRLLLLLAGLALEELSHQAPPNDADVHPSDQEADITEFTI